MDTRLSPHIKKKLAQLPTSSGVYFHKDANGQVLYIGKASILKNRVRQYFNNSPKDTKTTKLIQQITDIEWIETDSEIDALFLENEMIKRYKPQFNILLRDDKNNSFVRIDINSEWPTVTITRNPLDDKAKYIGPFYSANNIKRALRYLRKTFPYLNKESDKKERLLRQLHLIPDTNKSNTDYKKDLRRLIRYLSGDGIRLQKDLQTEMTKAAANLEFEKAAAIRNKLNNLITLKNQSLFGTEEFIDVRRDRALSGAQELLMLDKPPYRIECYDISHQSGTSVVGSMVVATNGTADRQQYRKFKVSQDKNDDFAAMIDVIKRRFSPRHSNWHQPDLIVVDGGYPQIKAISQLVPKIPIIGLAKNNDEIIVSKNNSYINTKTIEHIFLTSSQKSPNSGIKITNFTDYYSIDLHYGARHSASHSKTLVGETTINPYTDLLLLIQRLRDESHRFAITYHQLLKRKSQTRSSLDDIPRVGVKTKQKLLRKFGSVRKISMASQQDLANAVGKHLAEKIKCYLSD